jgi:catechol 2,3-dioxygenase-like lactoylglutathione lyase family enzyme
LTFCSSRWLFGVLRTCTIRGIGRIALFTKNLDEEYQRLKAAGVDLVSEPVVIRFGNKAGAKFFCFKDPDGTFLELIEPYNG